MSTKFIMRRIADGKFFVTRRPDTGLGDLVTSDPNKAAIYNHANPMGFAREEGLRKAIEVQISIVII